LSAAAASEDDAESRRRRASCLRRRFTDGLLAARDTTRGDSRDTCPQSVKE
jgi:hypothetical protein